MLHDPQRYTYIDMPSFRSAMEAMQARNIPEYITIESYTKLMRIILKFITADPSLANGYRTLFPDPKLYVSGSMLMALDFVQGVK